MNSNLKKELAITACKVRMGIIEGTHSAKSGHPGGSLSAADVLTYLYFCEMNVDPQHPDKADRDRLVLSKGHVAPALYAVLAHKGYFPVEELKTLRKIGSRLQGHPDMKKIPGVDMSSGSLGQGISAACGMAKAAKLQNADWRVYAVLGDGEIQEGQVWEAAMFASHYHLDNLCVLVDNNGLQIDGNITPYAPFYYIDRVGEGDYLYLYDSERIYRYIHERTWVVEPDDWSPIATTGYSCITITSCEPIGIADHRIICRGVLDQIFDYTDDFTFISNASEEDETT